MTQRKPAAVRFETWVDRLIREATERGDLHDLPGAGKPLAVLDTDELAWVRDKVRREGVPVTTLLPPSLAVAREAEDLPVVLARLRTERAVREHVDGLNARIDAARRGPAAGPPVRTRLLDLPTVLAQWRALHPAPTPPAPAAGDAPASRRRWPRREGVAATASKDPS